MNPVGDLSDRKRTVLGLLYEGSSNEEIAGRLNISMTTGNAEPGTKYFP